MLHASASARTLALVRIWVFGLWLLWILPDCFACFADFSPSQLSRLGVLRLLPRNAVPWLLDARLLAASKVVLVVLLLLALLGVRPYRVFAIAAATLLTFYAGLPSGLVQPTHIDLALLLVTVVLALSPAADAYAWRKVRPPERPPAVYAAAMITMTLLFLMTYCLVGSRRLVLSSPEIFLTPTMRYYVASDILRPTHNPFLLGEWLLVRPVALSLFQMGFALITLFELLSPWCLIHRRLRHVWIAVMVVFHAASYVFMNVLFASNVLLFPALLLDHGWLSGHFDRTRRLSEPE
jgi:hypothetical protein